MSGLLAGMFLALPRAVVACTVCFGQSDSPMAKATNMGIFLMLGVVAVVLGSFASFFIYLIRRAHLVESGTVAPAGATAHAEFEATAHRSM